MLRLLSSALEMKYLFALAFLCPYALTINAFELPFKLPFNINLPFGKGNKPELFALHKELINTPSITESEHEVGKFLANYLKDRNYTVETIPGIQNSLNPADTAVEDGSSRENIYAYIGKDRNPRSICKSLSFIDYQNNCDFAYRYCSAIRSLLNFRKHDLWKRKQ